MRQGAAEATSSGLALRRDDLYETPPEAVTALLAHERLVGPLWEPCAGRGAISRILRRRGFTVVAEDLVPHEGADPDITPCRDFLLEWQPRPAFTIVTNPPFKLANAFIRKGLELCPKVVVLLPLARLEGAERSDLVDGHLARLWVGRERLPMMHREGYEGPKQDKGGIAFAWFVFLADHPAGAPWAGRRISWSDT